MLSVRVAQLVRNKGLMVKKSVHINLLKETHSELRVLAFKKQLSMQSIIEGLVSRLVNGDPNLVKIIDKIADEKANAEIRKVMGTDAESVYDLLETYDTIKED